MFEKRPPQDKVPLIMKHLKSQIEGKMQLGEFLSSIRCNRLRKGAWHRVCVDEDCQQSAIICNKADCDCRKSHKRCQKEIAESFVSKAIQKSKVRVNNQWLDSMKVEISKISVEIEEIYARLRLCFLDRNEGNFIFCMQSGNTAELQKLTGSQMHSVLRELEMPISKEGVKEKVKKVWSNVPLQKIEDMVETSLRIVDSLQEKRQWFQKNTLEQIRLRKEEEAERAQRAEIAEIQAAMGSSKVLSSVEEWRVLFEMFPKDRRPKGFKLLFRASDYGFDVTNNKEKYCGVAHTVLLVKTEYGKVIGGYTPLKWKITKKKWGQRQFDTSGESFIFSISNNHKLTLESPTTNPAFAHLNECGPWFQGAIQILNKSNTENRSWSLWFNPLKYVHPEYKGMDKESWIKFLGSSNVCFRTQQWEVHQVIFEEQP